MGEHQEPGGPPLAGVSRGTQCRGTAAGVPQLAPQAPSHLRRAGSLFLHEHPIFLNGENSTLGGFVVTLGASSTAGKHGI